MLGILYTINLNGFNDNKPYSVIINDFHIIREIDNKELKHWVGKPFRDLIDCLFNENKIKSWTIKDKQGEEWLTTFDIKKMSTDELMYYQYFKKKEDKENRKRKKNENKSNL